ncbi:MAG: hypothetical protein EP330_22720 [Deltaproteobacteria bacterium]|nr:MAG: hypothetical protein EP330_22720 [Deltaproteobacteria bacterium]
MRGLCLVLCLVACAEQPVVASVPEAPVDELDLDALSRVDVRGTTAAITRIAERLAELPDEDRVQASASLAWLVANDPYTRAAMQMPVAMHASVSAIDARRLDPLVAQDWQYLQLGLATHVAALETLGVDLTAPVPGDGLHGEVLDREAVLAGPGAVMRTTAFLEDIPRLVALVDPETRALMDEHSARVEALTGIGRPCPRTPFAILPGQPWTLGMQLAGWHDALRRIEPFATDPEVHAEVLAMMAMMDASSEANWACPVVGE